MICLMNSLTHGTPPGTNVTGICPVDGPYEVIGQSEGMVAVKFHESGLSSVIPSDGKIFDMRKRARSGDSAHWHDVAVAMKGYTYPNGRVVKDVISESRVILEDGGVVRYDYIGALPKIRSKSAYAKWNRIMQEACSVAVEWHSFEVFQQWYEDHLPQAKRRWALRSVDGTWTPLSCGFDDRTDLPVCTATLERNIFVRYAK